MTLLISGSVYAQREVLPSGDTTKVIPPGWSFRNTSSTDFFGVARGRMEKTRSELLLCDEIEKAYRRETRKTAILAKCGLPVSFVTGLALGIWISKN